MKMSIFGIVVVAILTMLMASFCSCDSPQTIAWSYYHCAKDTLDFLEGVTKGTDEILDYKADSLRIIIEKAIEEDKTKTGKDSI